MVVLYHYTSHEGKDDIIADRLIRATDSEDGLGKVVQFTQLADDTSTARLIANNWRYQAPEGAEQRLKFCFKFNSKDLPAKKVPNKKAKGRNIWVCGEDVPLEADQEACNKTYYHYTNRADRDAILKRGYIEAKCDWSVFNFDRAIELTDVAPTEAKSDIVYHMFGVKSDDITPALLAKTEHWFKFYRSELSAVTAHRKFKRRSWTTPTAMYFYAHDALPNGGSISSRCKAVMNWPSDRLNALDDGASYVYISAVKKL